MAGRVLALGPVGAELMDIYGTKPVNSVSDTNVTNTRGVLRRIPWKFVLPAIMLVVTAILYHLDEVWGRGAARWDDMPVTSAWGLMMLLNGPGFVLGKIFSLSGKLLLLGVASFWAWAGFLFDRRLRGITLPIIRRGWVRVVLYLVGLVLACLFLWQTVESWPSVFGGLEQMRWLLLRVKSPRRILLGRQIITLGGFVWGLGYAAYFSSKLWHFFADRREIAKVEQLMPKT